MLRYKTRVLRDLYPTDLAGCLQELLTRTMNRDMLIDGLNALRVVMSYLSERDLGEVVAFELQGSLI